MQVRHWLIYGANLKDMDCALDLAKRKLPAYSTYSCICEKKPGRMGFEELINRAKPGNGVYISALQALRDDNDDLSIMDKISLIENKGLVLMVGFQKGFTYSEYKIWFEINSEIRHWDSIYSLYYEVEEDELEYVDFPEDNTEISFYTCACDTDFYSWN